MKKKILQITAWLHSVMLLALPILIVFLFLHKGNDTLAYTLYFKSFIILVPVAATDIAVLRTKNYRQYMLGNVIILLITAIASLALCLTGQPDVYGYVQLVIIFIEIIVLFISRMQDRIRRNRYEQETSQASPGEITPPGKLLWNQPSFAFLIAFILLYAIALNTASPSICNIALGSTIVYFFITLLHHFIDTSENYLFLNKDIHNVPARRIYRISSIMVELLAVLLLLTCIPALTSTKQRQYRDIRDVTFGSAVSFDQLMMSENMNNSSNMPEMSLDDMLNDGEPPKQLPEWVNYIVYVLTAIIFIVVAIVLIRQLRHALLDFEKQSSENDDLIEDLNDKDTFHRLRRPERSHDRSYAAQIRRKYRRMIRKHRKDTPYPSESPTEIETAAGLQEDVQMQELHDIYEQVRYGKHPEYKTNN